MPRATTKRTITVTMEIDVADLPMEELRENAKLGECKVSDLPRLRDFDALQIADQLAGVFSPDASELFAGSDMHIQAMTARVVAATYKE